MPFTGERFTPGSIQGGIVAEHHHRYVLASALANGKEVLDIASGEGYGTAYLAEVAIKATGVDISREAVDFASKKYSRANLCYKQGDCSAIPLPDHSVDIVISFETIEHHDQHDAMMKEIKRVLRPSGLLIISSPDRKNYSDIPKFKNEFHVHELYREEFETLLKSHFKHQNIFGQRLFSGSLILSLNKKDNSFLDAFEESSTVATPFNWADKVMYEIAIASDVELPSVSSSIFESGWMQREYQGHIQHRENMLKILNEENLNLKAMNSGLISEGFYRAFRRILKKYLRARNKMTAG